MSREKNKVVLQLGISYILIIVFLVASITLLLGMNTRVLEKLNNKYCQSVFEYVSKNSEKTTQINNELFSAFVNYDALQEIMTVNSFEDYFNIEESFKLIERLSYKKPDNVEYYIFFPKTDSVISNGGIYTADAYYKGYVSARYNSKDEWVKAHEESSAISQNSSLEYSDSVVLKKEYITPLFERAYFVTVFDSSYFIDSDNFPVWIAECDIYISNVKEKVLMSRQSSAINKPVTYISSLDELYGDEWGVFSSDFSNGMIYTVSIVYPKAIIWEEVQRVKKLEISIAIFTILLGFVIALYAIKKNCSPLSRVFNALNITKSKDGYGDMEKRIHEIVSKKALYEKKLKDNMKQMVLARCLSKGYSAQHIHYTLKKAGIKFKRKYFCLCQLDIFDITEMYGNETVWSKEEKFSDLSFIADNVFVEIFEENASVVTVEDNIFIIINTDTSIIGDDMHKKINSALDFIQEHFVINLSYVLSDVYEDEGDLAEAYNQCLYLLRYKLAMGIADTITSVSIEKMQKEASGNLFSSKTEQRFLNALTVGNTEMALLILNEVFSSIFNYGISGSELKCVLIDVGTCLGKLPNYKIEYEKIVELSDDVFGMESFLTKTVKEICSYSTSLKKPSNNKLAAIVEYIDQNFNEVLNLDILSDKFNLSSRHLSRIFKSYVGVGILDYINNTRISCAKKLLKETDMSIQQIAIECGCGNVRSFNRIFQKIEGITPSEYRLS